MVPCANGDTVAIQKLRQVVRVRSLECEADDCPFLGRVGRSEDLQAVDPAQDLVGMADQRSLMGGQRAGSNRSR